MHSGDHRETSHPIEKLPATAIMHTYRRMQRKAAHLPVTLAAAGALTFSAHYHDHIPFRYPQDTVEEQINQEAYDLESTLIYSGATVVFGAFALAGYRAWRFNTTREKIRRSIEDEVNRDTLITLTPPQNPLPPANTYQRVTRYFSLLLHDGFERLTK
jgi:hypothetical protein